MIEDLEEEVTEMRAIAARSGAAQLKKLEDDNKKVAAELVEFKTKNEELLRETSEFWKNYF